MIEFNKLEFIKFLCQKNGYNRKTFQIIYTSDVITYTYIHIMMKISAKKICNFFVPGFYVFNLSLPGIFQAHNTCIKCIYWSLIYIFLKYIIPFHILWLLYTLRCNILYISSYYSHFFVLIYVEENSFIHICSIVRKTYFLIYCLSFLASWFLWYISIDFWWWCFI